MEKAKQNKSFREGLAGEEGGCPRHWGCCEERGVGKIPEHPDLGQLKHRGGEAQHSFL